VKIHIGRGGVTDESPPQLSGQGSSTEGRGERSEDWEQIFHAGVNLRLSEGLIPPLFID